MLINSLSALFAFTRLINPLEACITVALTFYIVYIFTPKQNSNDNDAYHLAKIAANDKGNGKIKSSKIFQRCH